MHDTETGPPTAPSVPADTRTQHRPDGSVSGYHSHRTLPVRAELRRQLTRRRTRLMLGFLAVLPAFLLLAFELGGGGDRDGTGARDLADMATTSGLNFAVFTLFVATGFLLVVMAALFFGDTVAIEASWSSLKYLLAAPIPRARLLRQKAIVAAILTGFGLGLLILVALGLGVWWYGWDALLTPSGEVLGFPAGMLGLVGAGAYLAVHLMWIAGLALWFSVSTDAPLGAVGGAVLVSILSQILDGLTVLGELRMYLPTHYSTAWFDLLSTEIDWTAPVNGAFSGMAYATVFALLALYRFHRKDITS
ncbi:ABC transporter permease [Haloactinomyces albus]|uniref:ABC-2 type transport system permease protein n=1 Tax=Haloactinomyces albus TaxID=1352928 RepID=A0AAE3ZAY2_9ACTN|nr:ABC transporter permease subunit [Haloactinomyces albus]MDR7300383.1 ABC-2 type transport system permease protein [Haloactinomyces albus]